MISAIVTAAGKNRRMIEDLKARGLKIRHKLLLDLHGKPVLVRTLENVLSTGVEECALVLGHFSKEIKSALDDFDPQNLRIIENPQPDVELSETLLNGVLNVKPGLCLCVAADQPTVSTETLKNLIERACNHSHPQNIVSIMARRKTGYLDSAEGLGMPFICHSELLQHYLNHKQDNLNPILREMIADGVVFYGVPARNELELVNINRWDDYLMVLKGIRLKKKVIER
jgi:molybdenum cofactor cytidylyltransferase